MAPRLCEPGSYLGTLRRYCVVEKLQDGSNGTVVVRATDTMQQEDCAIKIILRKNLAMKYTEREVLIHMGLSHKHIVNFREVFDSGPHLCIVMDYCPNKTLFDWIQLHECLTEDQAKQFCIQIVSGLIYLHRQGIALRDLKLENLLLDAEWNIKICDLGFATSDEFSRPKSFLGTPEYYSPELIHMADDAFKNAWFCLFRKVNIGPYDGKKVDAWTLGIVLFAMLFGQTPFAFPNEDPMYSVHRTRRMKYSIPERTRNNIPVSIACRNLLERLLEEDPIDRLSVDGMLEHEWLRPLRHSIDEDEQPEPRELTRSDSIKAVKSVKRAAGWRRFLPSFVK
ncbi:hypothetical protein BSKO_06168 [Bryopsis sp. KO-2023]|nr:hypothetical protein BSKO_06168 [Bryopsis sp. KO-2023]